MAQLGLQALNLMPRVLNDTLDKSNEITINTNSTSTPAPVTTTTTAEPTTNGGDQTVLTQRPVQPGSSSVSSSLTSTNTSTTAAIAAGSTTSPTSSLSTNERHKKCQYHCAGGSSLSNRLRLYQPLSNRDAAARYLQDAAAQRNCCRGGSGSGDVIDGPAASSSNTSLINDRYMLLDLVEGSTLFRCIDVKTNSDHVCKVSVVMCDC